MVLRRKVYGAKVPQSPKIQAFLIAVIKRVIKRVIRCVIKLSIKSSSKTQRLQFVNQIIVENFGLIDYAKKKKNVECSFLP